ncbi:MAG: TVP38/TMEM64 family protein [Vicinamibacterales bacterium]
MRLTKGAAARAGGVLVLALLAFELAALVPFAAWAEQLSGWIRSAGAAGVVVFAAVYVAAAVFMLPGSVLTLMAGFAFGPVWGTVLVSPVSVLAATLAFTLGRTVARARVASRAGGDPRFSAIDRAIGDQGFRVVALLRLSPVLPFNLLNYALGLTRVSLRDYVLASWIGMLPGTVLYVYLGSIATNLSAGPASEGTDAARAALYWGGLLATIMATLLITRAARRALAETLEVR